MMVGLGAAVELRCPEGYAPNAIVYAQGSAGHSAPYGGYTGTCYKADVYQWESGEAEDSPRRQAWHAARPPDVPALNWDEFKASRAPAGGVGGSGVVVALIAAVVVVVLVMSGRSK